ncbi:MAG: choice-of-anchor D domain-containing protein [Methylococcaceae bacterium]|nr:choice-of-anchor D domain-containing protein [Methylococcaceae bacterium]
MAPGTPGVIDNYTIVSGGQNYVPGAKVVFSDPNRTASGNTDAVAHVTTVDANGAITGIAIDNPGTGYTATTTTTIEDIGSGTGATATATAKKVSGVSGVITAVKVTAAGSGYRNPVVEITDANAGAAGQGAVLVATTYNYATDQQTDKVMDVQVLNPGSGYDAGTTVTVSGGTGAIPVTVTPIIVNGAIVGIDGIDIPDVNSPTGYIRDPNFAGLNAGLGLGSGFKTPLAGSGIRKFVDTLPGLNAPNNLGQQMPIGVADTTTFPGSDYYEIAEVEYTQKLHTDLPATHLRGYVQIKTGGFDVATYNGLDAAGKLTYASQYAGYLGPVIVAQKDRPVRIKLVNLLSTGAAGKLPVPVDTTYMGADGATDTDNRTSMHLHGGNTPWISDGTARQWTKPAGEAGSNKGESARSVPDMWFDASGNLITTSGCQGTTTCGTEGAANYVAGATNNPGDGALTFFYTNEQSARLMFYHDHAEGITRLNVYAGMVAGYVLQDPTEQAMISGVTAHEAAVNMGYTGAELAKYDNTHVYAANTLPPLEDTISLIIQEKTFVPDNTTPVLNFYGPFSSALNSQDPTWRWGTGAAAVDKMGNGDLWVPHVFMPNQNPGDVSGANAVGRWDYGAWFWPPFVNLQNGPIANPYFDPNCNTTTSYCEGPEIPGVPNGSQYAVLSNGVHGGVTDATHGGAITESPSGTPEAFNDTPLVNGTAYPYINVDPKKYRLRILSVGNDRMLNLSMVVAASKNTDSTAAGNTGPTGNQAVLCDGSTTAPAPEDCTEVKMVPFDAAQNTAKPFPGHWYTKQKGGVTFDGRPSGVFDPTTSGPEMVQIGTEGGFLAAPVEIKNQPVNYEYNPKNILIGNIKEHALLLGPAERADVLVDFSNFAGSTLLLYNDAGAPVPAWDLRLDYYTGNFDNTDTGGAFSVIPGYGPNSRTLMQIRVSGSGGTHPVDDKGNINLTTLATEVQTAFKSSQEPIIVPQSVYNNTYGMSFPDALGADLSRIGDHWLTYSPLSPRNPLDGSFTLLAPVKLELEPKTIIEDWTMNWGRMNALLGTEVPHTTAINQTSIPQAFIDPPTDLVKITPNDNMVPISGTLPDGTQIWKITHNGVDSHSIHFHLFHVQIVNRVGWDGAVYPPDANELGWKDSVRMNPLSDTIVALRPMSMTALPFKVPNSHRLLDPALAQGATSTDFFNFSPLSGNGANVTNEYVNYGWEYLWHCHILGHEENDMMRTIAVAQPPETPSAFTATTVANGVKLDWVDNSIISNWVTIQRSTDSGFTPANTITINLVEPECNSQAGCARTYTDTTAPVATSVYYKITANNTVGAGDGKLDAPRNPDGTYGGTLPAELASLTPGFTDYANVTANSDTVTTSRLAIPTATVTAGPLSFGDQLINTTSAAQTVTVSNTGTGNLAISSVALTSGANFGINNSCPASLAPAASCNISVTFKPTGLGALADTLTITDNSSTGPTQTVTLNGNGTAPIAGVSLGTLTFGNQNVGTISAAQTVTLSNTGTAPLTIAGIVVPAPFAQTNACGASLAAGSSCSISLTFNPTAAGAANGNLVITDNSNGVNGTPQTVALSGTGVVVAPVPPAVPSVLRDNFNRANANTLGGTWQQTALFGASVLRVNGNQATANALGLTGYAYSNTVGTATQGAGFTFANTTVNNTALFLKATGSIGAVSGQLQNAIRVLYNAGNVTVATTTNGNGAATYANVGAGISTGGALVNGNSLQAAVDNTGKVWVWKVVGATTTLLTPTGVQLPNNALWTTGGGKAGMQLPNGARVDNFVAY